MCLEVVTYVIFHFNPNTPFLREGFYLVSLGLIKTFHTQSLLKEGPFDFIVCFLKIHFENNAIEFFWVNLMERFMQDDNPF